MCGIFGVFSHPEAANIAYLGLHSLQHRGQESAGIVSGNGQQLIASRHMGHVAEVFSEGVISKLKGQNAIGHVRYSTTGISHIKNAQPFAVDYAHGTIAIAHNGNLVNALHLRAELERHGSIFQSSMDTEVIVHLMARSKEPDLPGRLVEALRRVQGAYSILVLTQGQLIAVRDPMAIRPLALGRCRGAQVFASESCAFDLIEAEFIRDLEPGEMVVVDHSGLRTSKPFEPKEARHCVFEQVYFARPDSIMDGRSVIECRTRMGRRLAQEHPVEADVVIAVPDSGVAAAVGYSSESGVPFQMGLIRSHYVGRTFIEPQQSIRNFGVKLKLNPARAVIEGKRVVVVDDSIVRGTTSRKIIAMIRAAGAREVHFRISCPPTRFPCFYGIDTPYRRELIASSHTVEEIARYLRCESLGYLSIEGLLSAVQAPSNGAGFCEACFTGDYPVPIPEPAAERQLSLLGS
ncbi:MAG: amidophosphoribosyltransferase [Polyangia bacterium]|jgi:amidophosphoribosyltransferase|nr:amidophosphoribosyltransferase [Polyangia bacterium]